VAAPSESQTRVGKKRRWGPSGSVCDLPAGRPFDQARRPSRPPSESQPAGENSKLLRSRTRRSFGAAVKTAAPTLLLPPVSHTKSTRLPTRTGPSSRWHRRTKGARVSSPDASHDRRSGLVGTRLPRRAGAGRPRGRRSSTELPRSSAAASRRAGRRREQLQLRRRPRPHRPRWGSRTRR
jgi:hypothetical protein